MTHTTEQVKLVVDGLSVSTLVAALAGWLPAIAAGLTILWTGIRIWESKTVQKLAAKLKRRK